MSGGVSRRNVLAGAGAGLLLPSALRAATTRVEVPEGWKLTFHDEFDDPDLSRFNEAGQGARPGAPSWRSRYRHDRFTIINKEKQIYVDPAFAGTAGRPLGLQPLQIADGILRIRCERIDPAVRPSLRGIAYSSGCITTEGQFSQTYGRFEIRAKLPLGKGFWPAFWLLPVAEGWPPEIDVVEGNGMKPGAFHVAELVDKKRKSTKWIRGDFNVGDGFHVYAVEWLQDQIVWFFDGNEVFRAPNEIHQPMYLLANLAVGSHDPNFIPDPDESTPFPGVFEIDYIRAYQKV